MIIVFDLSACPHQTGRQADILHPSYLPDRSYTHNLGEVIRLRSLWAQYPMQIFPFWGLAHFQFGHHDACQDRPKWIRKAANYPILERKQIWFANASVGYERKHGWKRRPDGALLVQRDTAGR